MSKFPSDFILILADTKLERTCVCARVCLFCFNNVISHRTVCNLTKIIWRYIWDIIFFREHNTALVSVLGKIQWKFFRLSWGHPIERNLIKPHQRKYNHCHGIFFLQCSICWIIRQLNLAINFFNINVRIVILKIVLLLIENKYLAKVVLINLRQGWLCR